MRRTRHIRRGAGALVAVGALLGLALQTTPASADSGGTTPGSVVSKTAQHDSAETWTAERMRKAVPLDLLDAGSRAVERAGQAVPRGEELKVPAVKPDAGTMALPEAGGPWSGGGDIVQTSGRVFFKMGGRDASCSGNAVTSDNGSTVMTAGHCVKYQGSWHTDWAFVPGYHDGEAPHGRWTAAKTLTTPQWEASEDMNFDVGAAVVNPLDGKKLTDVVGGQGLSFNAPYDTTMYSFGFPAADPYDGAKLIYCSGTTFRDFLLTSDHGLSCNMTGGSSGGPWFTEFDEATGTGLQSSVNSFGYTFLPDTMFGPYFGEDAQKLYDSAQAG
ncbi:trypsin-like serine peptidase [Streptomyces albidus (ex Kaewkla and Franco 2022)]|uniref:trypsin-like serine peptidase n=1 Tax=Streptomyces albidus (ex Kaewkla and Franco 2022) TaxID=722709 RepID=UPI0015EED9B4|nr:peptidase [Streptomyces albidus (ex Kaewkla and Franco 2022)]